MRRIQPHRARGLTLVELMVAMAVGLLLLTFLVQIFAGVRSASMLQAGLASVQEDGRLALSLVAEEVRKAGYRDPVWNEPLTGYQPITANSSNGAAGCTGGARVCAEVMDRLQVMYQDPVDCTGVLNTNLDPDTDEPQARYKRVTIDVALDGDNYVLQWNCEYGPSPTNLTQNPPVQTIINGVEGFQVLYGVDTDMPPDFSVNRWVGADAITPQTSVCLQSQYLCETGGLLGAMSDGVPVAVQIALLVRSPDPAGGGADTQSFDVLGVTVAAPASSDPTARMLRKLYTTTISLRNLTL
jgi:type IV pilus assembly protein PilW